MFCAYTYYTPLQKKQKHLNTKLVQLVIHFRSLNPQLCQLRRFVQPQRCY